MRQVVRTAEEICNLNNNRIIGVPSMNKSQIVFEGTGNVLYCEDDVKLDSCTLRFNGNNGLIVLGSSRHQYKIDCTANSNCTIAVGRNVYFNGMLHAIASEECAITIGNDCLLSFGIWIRTADPHLIFDIKSHDRINPSKNVTIGDHVWIGQGAMLLKGTVIGSGSIVGAMSVVSGKRIHSNSSWAGNPAKPIRDDLFWEGSCVHTWTEEQTKKHRTMNPKNFVFNQDASTLDAASIPPYGLLASERLEYYQSIGYKNAQHNRFFVPKKSSAATQVAPSTSTQSTKSNGLRSLIRMKR